MDLVVLNKGIELEKDVEIGKVLLKTLVSNCKGGYLLLSCKIHEKDDFEKDVKSVLEKIEESSDRRMDNGTLFFTALRWINEYRKYLNLEDFRPCNTNTIKDIIVIVFDKLEKSSFDEDNKNFDVSDFCDAYFGLINTLSGFDKLSRLHRLPSYCYKDFIDRGFSVKFVRRVLYFYRCFKSISRYYDMYDMLVYFNRLLSNNADCRKRFCTRYSLIIADELTGLNSIMVECISPVLDRCCVFNYEGEKLNI